MLTKKIWLIIGAFAILSAGVMGVNAYLSKKPAPATETPEEITEESTVTEPEESTSTVPEEISSSSEIDTSDWKTYRNDKLGIEFSYPIFQDKDVKITEVSSEWGEVWAVKIIIDGTNSNSYEYETIMISKTKKEDDLCEHLDLLLGYMKMKKCVDRELTNFLGTLDKILVDSNITDYLGYTKGVSGKMICGAHGNSEYDVPVSISCTFATKKEDYIIDGNVYGATLWFMLQTGGQSDKIIDREIVEKRQSTLEKNLQAVNELVASNMLPLKEDVVDTINMVYETLVID